MPETCPQCPNKKSKLGCPAWLGAEEGILETNTATGEERIVTGCFYKIIPRLMAHVIQASNRPAASMESFRNEFVRLMEVAAPHVAQIPQRHEEAIKRLGVQSHEPE